MVKAISTLEVKPSLTRVDCGILDGDLPVVDGVTDKKMIFLSTLR
jgi:hypothetical protein